MTIMTIMQSSSVCNNLNNNNLFLSTNQQLSISLHSLVAFVALFGKLSFSTSFMCETSCAMFGQFRKYANRFTRKHNSKAISGILWSFEPNIVLLFPPIQGTIHRLGSISDQFHSEHALQCIFQRERNSVKNFLTLTNHCLRLALTYWKPSVWWNYWMKILFQANWPSTFYHQ